MFFLPSVFPVSIVELSMTPSPLLIDVLLNLSFTLLNYIILIFVRCLLQLLFVSFLFLVVFYFGPVDRKHPVGSFYRRNTSTYLTFLDRSHFIKIHVWSRYKRKSLFGCGRR